LVPLWRRLVPLWRRFGAALAPLGAAWHPHGIRMASKVCLIAICIDLNEKFL